MKVKKAGTILINLQSKRVGLVYRKEKDDYSFPKGHLEGSETLQECAVRETWEETGRKNHIIQEKEIAILEYITPVGENVRCYYYLSVDDGQSKNDITDDLTEELVWVSFKETENKLSYEDLKEVWRNVKDIVYNIFNN